MMLLAKPLHRRAILCGTLGMIFSGGCSLQHLPMVVEAVKDGKISGLPNSPTVSGMHISPEFADQKHYTQVHLLQNVWIGEAAEEAGGFVKMSDDAQLCSFILGQRASDGEWEIISAATRTKDGVWRTLEVQPDKHDSQVAAIAP